MLEIISKTPDTVDANNTEIEFNLSGLYEKLVKLRTLEAFIALRDQVNPVSDHRENMEILDRCENELLTTTNLIIDAGGEDLLGSV